MKMNNLYLSVPAPASARGSQSQIARALESALEQEPGACLLQPSLFEGYPGVRVLCGFEGHLRAARRFFRHARRISGRSELRHWLQADVLKTLAAEYAHAPRPLRERALAALQRVYAGAHTLGWVAQDSLDWDALCDVPAEGDHA